MDIPFLKDEQFAVGKAENTTGIVLNNDGTFFKKGDALNKMYDVFNSYEEAKKYALQKIEKNPNTECWIVNSQGKHIITYDRNGERTY